jgi:hypothetical protein
VRSRPRKIGVGGDANWETQEKTVAKALKGRRTRGSGCGREKGDVIAASFLAEGKTTSADSIAVKRSVLAKIASESFSTSNSKSPLLVIGFDRPVYGAVSDFAVVPLGVLEALVMAAEHAANGNIEEAREYARRVIK